MKKIVNDDNSILAIEYNNIWMPIMTIPRYRYKRETETNSNSNKNLIKHLTKKIKHLHATLQQNIDSKKYDLYDIYKTLHKNNTGMSSQERGQLGNII